MSAQLAFSAHNGAATAAAVFAQNPWAKAPVRDEPSSETRPASGPVIHFAPDQQIYDEGDDADVFFKVVSGVVRTCKFLGNGRRQIDAFYLPGDVFGLEAGDEHSLAAEAVCHCTVVAYRRRGVESQAAADERLSHQLFSYALKSAARAQEHALLLGRKSAAERLAAFLIEWAEHSPDGKVATLAMARQDIADYLGLTIETVSRTLSQLEREKVIELPSTRQIRLRNVDVLRELNS